MKHLTGLSTKHQESPWCASAARYMAFLGLLGLFAATLSGTATGQDPTDLERLRQIAEAKPNQFGMPAVFSDHMVLQSGRSNKIWGWGIPGGKIDVYFDNDTSSTVCNDAGRWEVFVNTMTPGTGHTLRVSAGAAGAREFTDVAVGEVWVCSGQSNMEWDVNYCKDGDLDKLQAKHPNIRLLSIPKVGMQVPQRSFQGAWKVCSPEEVGNFSSVGYNFGLVLANTLDVPIGLIDNAWGGSAAEAWVRRDELTADGRFNSLLDSWKEREANKEHLAAMERYELELAAWSKGLGNYPNGPSAGDLAGNHRPGNLYNGNLHPILGYGIRGVIWYQGESNAGRAYQYRDLFPFMIQNWRNDWGIGDFPFYWVQLADFMEEREQPGDSAWAELREAQTMTMDKLPATGEAVTIDIGEGDDIHPKNKQDVGRRLARWALAKQYGIPIAHQSPRFHHLEQKGATLVLHFDHVGGGLQTIDLPNPVGFAVAGEDKAFDWAQAKITGPNTIEVTSAKVAKPVAVRYAWGDNPKNNVHSSEGLPLTPFRSDDWPGVTAGK